MRSVRRILLFLSYLLVGALIVGATIILVAVGQGYSYNFKTHHFSLQGLLILGSNPQGGTVRINGKDIRRKTPYRSTMEAGQYQVEVHRDGYKTWQRQIMIQVSEVAALPYILLIPQDLNTAAVVSGNVDELVATRDRHHFAYMTAGTDAGVWLLNSDRRPGAKLYTPHPALPDQPAEVLNSITWSEDGSHLLVKSSVGAASVYNIISTSPNTPAINLTDVFKFDFSGLQFNPNNWRELYWISPEGLRRVDVEARNVSAVLAEKVSGYTFAGDRILYIQTTSLGKTVWSVDRSGRDAKRLIESLAESDSYEMLYINTRGKDLLAILPQQSNTATVYGDIFSATPVAKVVSKAAAHIAFNDDGHYLAFYSPTSFGTYDTEKNAVVAISTDGLTSLSWFDSYHLLLNQKGKLYLTEFDGANNSEISASASATSAYSSSDQHQILFLRPADNGSQGIAQVEIKR